MHLFKTFGKMTHPNAHIQYLNILKHIHLQCLSLLDTPFAKFPFKNNQISISQNFQYRCQFYLIFVVYQVCKCIQIFTFFANVLTSTSGFFWLFMLFSITKNTKKKMPIFSNNLAVFIPTETHQSNSSDRRYIFIQKSFKICPLFIKNWGSMVQILYLYEYLTKFL